MTNTTALDFCLRLSRTNSAFILRLDSALGEVHGIGYSDFQLLFYMQRAPGGRIHRDDLAERLVLTISSVTRALQPLEKIGLVSRQSDPSDARIGYAVLTEAGQNLLQDAHLTAMMVCEELLKDTEGEQLTLLAPVLAQIAGMNVSNTRESHDE